MKIITESERLLVREFNDNDVSFIYKLHNDVDVMRYISTKQEEVTESECSDFLSKCKNYYVNHKGLGIWATVLKETNEFIGWTTLKDLDNTDDIELGYRYFKCFWGKGFGTEISIELIKYGFDELKLPKIVAVALPENKASTRIMDKIGMEYIGMKRYYKADVAYYQIYNPNNIL